ncbi:MAG: hypothetical protein ACREWG_05595 [Gammaproteobacteria bacterium]
MNFGSQGYYKAALVGLGIRLGHPRHSPTRRLVQIKTGMGDTAVVL